MVKNHQDNRRENKAQNIPEKSSAIAGNISGKFPGENEVILAAFSLGMKENQIVDYIVMPEHGFYVLYVPPGKYNVLAFVDFNGNGFCESDEYIGSYNNNSTLEINEFQVKEDINIEIQNKERKTFDYPVDYELQNIEDHRRISPKNGDVVSLENPIFSKDNSDSAYWLPYIFLKTIGGNIYLLEQYDPSKTVVLFMNGAYGSPADFEFIINNLDTKKYQAFFYYYPTGLSISDSAALLNEQLTKIVEKFDIKNMCIIAHSMGGLVGREFINIYSKEPENHYLKLFITMSTPFGGYKGVEIPIENTPEYIVPCWKDINPDSEFLKRVFDKPVPDNLTFYLFFGYKTSGIINLNSNDGTITLESQLSIDAQEDADWIRGFNESHSSILKSEDAFREIEKILNNNKF